MSRCEYFVCTARAKCMVFVMTIQLTFEQTVLTDEKVRALITPEKCDFNAIGLLARVAVCITIDKGKEVVHCCRSQVRSVQERNMLG